MKPDPLDLTEEMGSDLFAQPCQVTMVANGMDSHEESISKMEILGIGVPELALIVLIALILLGPKEMLTAGRTIGLTLRKFLTSPAWQVMRHTGQEIRKLPEMLAHEAGIDDLHALQNEIQGLTRLPANDGSLKNQPIDSQSALDSQTRNIQSVSGSVPTHTGDLQPVLSPARPEMSSGLPGLSEV